MGKIKRIFFLYLMLLSSCLYANDSTINYQLQKTIKGNYNNFTTDNLGNIYLVTTTNQIKKLNNKLDSIAVFNDIKQYGNISFIDATNPFKILVFYKNYSTVIILDRFLNKIQTINLLHSNITQITAIALSYDNKIWLFDELNATVNKVDEYGKIVFAGTDFRLLFDEYEKPEKIIDSDGLLYLYNSKFGWIIFDYYGALKSKFYLPNRKDVDVENDFLYGRDDSLIYQTSIKTLITKQFKCNINFANAVKTERKKNLFYVLRKEDLQIFARQN